MKKYTLPRTISMLCFLVIVCSGLFLFCQLCSPVNAANTEDTSVSVTVTNFSSPGSSTVQPGDTAEMEVTVTVLDYSEELLEKPLYVYILDGFFEDVGDDPIQINNPDTFVTGAKVFRTNYLSRESSIPNLVTANGEYLCYSIYLNNSDALKQHYQTEPLACAAFSFRRCIVLEAEPATEKVIMEVKFDDEGSLSKGTITVDPKDPDGTPTLKVKKSIGKRYSLNGETNRYERNDSLRFVSDNDIVVFLLELSNDSEEAIVVDSITEELPAGYALPNYPIQQRFVEDPEVRRDDGDFKGSSDWAVPDWKKHSDQYVFTLPPQDRTIAPNTTYSTYFVAKVPDADVAANQLRNIARVKQENGNTPYAEYTPSADSLYDLALTTKIEKYYAESGSVSNISGHGAKLLSGSTIGVEYTVYNQGGLDVKDPVVYAYVPRGYSVDLDDDVNAGWTKVRDDIAFDDNTAIWSDLTVYKATLPGILASERTTSKLLKMTVVAAIGDDGNNARDWADSDYYVAGEIGSFQDTMGSTVDDLDSSYDQTVNNDLFYQGTYYPITERKKEEIHLITEQAKLYPDQRLDEDDFDFDFANVIHKQPATESKWVLEKGRYVYQTGDQKKEFIDIMAHDLYDSLADNGYSPLPTDGVIRSLRTYALYEIWINKDGLEDTANSTFTDELPPGLKFYDYKKSNVPNDPVLLTKFIAKQRVASEDDPTKMIINYDDPAYYEEHPILFEQTGADSNLYTDWMRRKDDVIDAADAGIKANITDGRRKLEIKFNSPSGSGAASVTDCAYRIFFVVELDIGQLQFQDMQNSATYQYEDEVVTSTETGSITWDSDSGAAFVRKYIDDGSGKYISAPDFLVREPDGNGEFSANYRIRLRSTHDFDAGKLNLSDAIPADIFKAFRNIQVNGYSGTGFDQSGQLENAVPIAPPLNVAANISPTEPNVLVIANDAGSIGENQVYYIDFTVDYRDVPYAKAICNTIGSSRTRIAVPLHLDATKEDADSEKPLSGYAFNVYYADANGKADEARPAINTAGNAIVLSDQANLATDSTFVPEGFVFGTASSWNLLCKETVTPAGYENNIGKEFPLTVSSDTGGNLTVAAGAAAEDLTVSQTSRNATLLEFGNEGETPSPQYGNLSIAKQVTGNAGELNRPFQFTVTFGDDQPHAYTINGVPGGTVTETGTLQLMHGETALFENLPKDLSYSVAEDDYTADGYTTKTSGANPIGAIAVDDTLTVTFVNDKTVAPLRIHGIKRDSTTFNRLDGYAIALFYDDGNGQADKARPVLNTAGEAIVLSDDPMQATEGLFYPEGYAPGTANSWNIVCEETAAPTDYQSNLGKLFHLTVTADATGQLTVAAAATETNVVVTPTQAGPYNLLFNNTKDIPRGATGAITLKKMVAGNVGERNRQFEFQVAFGDGDPHAYTVDGGSGGTITVNGTVLLKHGQTATFANLPENLSYSVTERNYRAEGYTTKIQGNATDTVAANTTKALVFTNTKNYYPPTPTLTPLYLNAVKKDAHTNQYLGHYAFAAYYADEDGSADESRPVINDDGEPIVISDLDELATDCWFYPEGYCGTEAKTWNIVCKEMLTPDGYEGNLGREFNIIVSCDSQGNASTASSQSDGSVTVMQTEGKTILNIANTMDVPSTKYAKLSITKTVAGNGGDTNRTFYFNVTFDDGQPHAYTINGNQGGSITKAGRIALKHGQTALFNELPENLQYTVKEDDYSEDGYQTTVTGEAEGKTSLSETKAVVFINTKNNSPPAPVTPVEPAKPADPPASKTTGTPSANPKTGDEGVPLWPWILGVAVLLIFAVSCRYRLRNKRGSQ